jgi:hypothetical protein
MLTYTHIYPIHPGGVKILTLHGPSASPPQKETRTDGRKRNVAVNRNTTHALQSSRERGGGLNKVRLLLLLSGTLQKKKGESFSGRIIPHTKPFGRHADALIASTIVLFVLVGRGGPRSQIERERMKQLPAQQTHKEKEGRKEVGPAAAAGLGWLLYTIRHCASGKK